MHAGWAARHSGAQGHGHRGAVTAGVAATTRRGADGDVAALDLHCVPGLSATGPGAVGGAGVDTPAQRMERAITASPAGPEEPRGRGSAALGAMGSLVVVDGALMHAGAPVATDAPGQARGAAAGVRGEHGTPARGAAAASPGVKGAWETQCRGLSARRRR